MIGDGNRLRRNLVEGNGAHGIRLFRNVLASVVARNVALDNGEVDLADDAPACGTNRWRANTFAVSSQACIQ